MIKYTQKKMEFLRAVFYQSDVFGYEVNIAKLEQIKAGN